MLSGGHHRHVYRLSHEFDQAVTVTGIGAAVGLGLGVCQVSMFISLGEVEERLFMPANAITPRSGSDCRRGSYSILSVDRPYCNTTQ